MVSSFSSASTSVSVSTVRRRGRKRGGGEGEYASVPGEEDIMEEEEEEEEEEDEDEDDEAIYAASAGIYSASLRSGKNSAIINPTGTSSQTFVFLFDRRLPVPCRGPGDLPDEPGASVAKPVLPGRAD